MSNFGFLQTEWPQLFADAHEAAAIVPELLQEGDVVLVKGSLGVGLKVVCDTLLAQAWSS